MYSGKSRSTRVTRMDTFADGSRQPVTMACERVIVRVAPAAHAGLASTNL
jgi:hypothetical protein